MRNKNRKLLLLGLVSATSTIPLINIINSISLILFVAISIWQSIPGLNNKLIRASLWMITLVYFLWMVCTYFWDTSGGFSFTQIGRYSSIAIIPLAVYLAKVPHQLMEKVLLVFIGVIVTVCIICLFKSHLEYQINPDSRLFFYHYLSQQMGLNAIFLSNYCVEGIVWLLYYSFLHFEKRGFLFQSVSIIVSCFLFLMIFLLSSKLIIGFTLLILVFLTLYIGYQKRLFVKALFLVIMILFSAQIAVNNMGYLKWRLSTNSFKKFETETDNNDGLSIRILMWKTTWDLIKEKPVLGYGLKGGYEKVLQKYKQQNFLLGYTQGYHSHNQYFQTALMGGIPALLLLIILLFRMAWKGIKQKNILLLILLFHFICQSVIESTFEVQQEQVFYILFLFLFYYCPPRNHTTCTKAPDKLKTTY
jgi:O-antigen ligase